MFDRARGCCFLAVFVFLSTVAFGQRDLVLENGGQRRALVIGNDAYAKGKLANAVNDARLMSTTLRNLNFQVDLVTDATDRRMEEAVDRFAASLAPADVALFYYAGHGVQIDGQNYLIPVDFSGTDEADVRYGARAASWVLDKIVSSGARLQIVVLDACRTDPFRATRALGGGLAQMQGGRGSFIAFATAAGSVANDNPNSSNGLFTSHLVTALNQPGLSLDEVFNRVRAGVDRESGGRQLPYIYSGVIGEFYFRPAAAASVAVSASTGPGPGSLPDAEVVYWDSIKDSRDPALFDSYLKRYPAGKFIEIANARLAELRRAVETQPVKENPRDGLRYVWAPPGTFQMGCSPGDRECASGENPHQVRIAKGFWIGQTEVTQEAYQRVMRANPSKVKGPKLPVETVSWAEAQSFCRAAGMRLPTEEEWEYAARAGSTAGRYGEADKIAWIQSNSNGATHEVGLKLPNAWGLYDVLGNVWEWTSETDPHLLRGGAYTSRRSASAQTLGKGNDRVSYRNTVPSVVSGNPVQLKRADAGMRCAGDAIPDASEVAVAAAIAPEYAADGARVKNNPGDGLRYVWVAAGSFQQGCSAGDTCPFTEKPAHLTTLSNGFWIGETPVTQEAYERVMGTNPSQAKGPKLPVESVSWSQAQSFCMTAGMRLPTEAEWEYAARAGGTKGLYGSLDKIAWHAGNSGGKTHDVGLKLPNAWGLFDTIGNVAEWTADWYADSYPLGTERDPQGPASGQARVVRGSPYGGNARNSRVSVRGALDPASKAANVGFRCVGS